MKTILASFCGVLIATSAMNTAAADGPGPVSFTRDVAPVLVQNCTGCHNPEKKKGGLDLSTFKGIVTGGKDGASVVAGHPEQSALVDQVTGAEPAMPEKGEKLKPGQVEILRRWIAEGATNDTIIAKPFFPVPEGKLGDVGPEPVKQLTVYHVPPVITAIAYSPDGKVLAISAYHEATLHQPDGSAPIKRLPGGSPKITSLSFSADSKTLIAGGGSPAQYGHVQAWTLPGGAIKASWKTSKDTVFGLTASADGERVAYGCADRSARVMALKTGLETLHVDQHSDWCLGAVFTVDGKRLLSGSRDNALKLINVENGQFIDDVNNPLEAVLCMSRHPREDIVAIGGGQGTPRIYRIKDNQDRTAGRNDTNLIRAFERQNGAVTAIAYNADGELLAVGAFNEMRIYGTKDGSRKHILGGQGGAVFAVAFSPDGKYVACGGYDGSARIYSPDKGELLKRFIPVPLEKPVAVARP
ncbi:MAG: c-type cytochrome domain-containing protein [Tepidisphaerales bacterium]